jgi:hypothetical protein
MLEDQSVWWKSSNGPHGWLHFAITGNFGKIAQYFIFLRTQKTEAVEEPMQISKYIMKMTIQIK